MIDNLYKNHSSGNSVWNNLCLVPIWE